MNETTTTERKFASYNEMLERARQIHPDAHVSLEYGRWVISVTIESEYEDYFTLPDRFEGTAAWAAFHSADQYDGNALYAFRDHSSYSNEPLEVIAERYNMIREMEVIKREWYDSVAKGSGTRSFEEVIAGSGKVEATEQEKIIINEWLSETGAASEYARNAPSVQVHIEKIRSLGYFA